MLIFELRGISKVFTMGTVEVPALRGVDLSIPKNEVVVILGPSGSGKSTLLNLIGGLDAPSEGVLAFQGKQLSFVDDKSITQYRRDKIGFIFQFYNLIPSLTALENVALATDIAPHPLSPLEALELVGLSARKDHFPSQLSGGEQQRVAIARAIAKRPEVLLCDEPTGALDVANGRQVLEALVRIHAELGTTMLIITHNPSIAQLAHRVVVMRDGMIVQESLQSPKHPSEVAW